MEFSPRNVAAETAALVEEAIAHAERSKSWTADRAGIPRTSFYRKLNRGKPNCFTTAELAAIARALGVMPSTLYPHDPEQVAA
ncbi:helix-turn-helix domain-containing protein [Agromyces sp. SYSU T00194]|uniref:helix-turn-helix domain-containing protein n=1 Tax=Agromyces chitinivorans TaxID=3158560 RepID=UPI0033988117